MNLIDQRGWVGGVVQALNNPVMSERTPPPFLIQTESVLGDPAQPAITTLNTRFLLNHLMRKKGSFIYTVQEFTFRGGGLRRKSLTISYHIAARGSIQPTKAPFPWQQNF